MLFNVSIVLFSTYYGKNEHNPKIGGSNDFYNLLYPKKQDPDTMLPDKWTEKGTA